MTALQPAAVLERLNWRYATKKFDATKKIDGATWDALEQAMVLAPSSYGLQPWRFVVVDDAGTRATLREASWNQPQVTDAARLVVFCRKLEMGPRQVDQFIDRIIQVRGVSRESLEVYKGMMNGSLANPAGLHGGGVEAWGARQCHIAFGFFLSACAMFGVDACPMEGFDPAKYDEILGLKARGLASVVIAAAGYRAADDAMAGMKKVRFPLEQEVLHV
ncbi:NAD(P)H-dependent oxidoreductase [soil metagenome]